MNYKAASLAAWMLGSSAGWASAATGAQMAGDGRFDFNLCTFGKVDYPRHARDLVSGSFDLMAQSLRDPGDDSRDIAPPYSSRCVGAYEIVAGTYRDHGVCTRRDADGDEWVMRYETATDLAGKWVAVGGTGKYEGMKVAGEYRPVGSVPGVLPGGFKTCYHNTGTYRLK